MKPVTYWSDDSVYVPLCEPDTIGVEQPPEEEPRGSCSSRVECSQPWDS